MDWTALEARLAQAIGLDAMSLGATVFRQAVERRMQARDVAALPAYLRILDAHAAELQSLVEELVVNESWFFRHAHAFDVLREHAVATMAERQAPYRVLSFPCAGGEEPYSIAMSLREAGLPFQQLEVDAADISAVALQKARAGVYGLRSVRVVPPTILERYFRVTPDSVEVLPETRQAVRFTLANIVETPSVLVGAKYDAVFCRNLFIYLTKAARQQVLRDIDRALSPGGLLFVGHAEMNQEFEEFFEPVRQRGAFAYGRRSAASPVSTALSVLPQISPRTGAAPAPIPARMSTPLPKGRSGKLQPSNAPNNSATTVSDNSSNDEAVRRASELSNASRFPEAIEICEQQIRRSGPSAQVYHTLGMVLQAAGMHEKAGAALERAVYLDPHHEDALLALALLARRRGDESVADRFQQRSLRAHDRSLKS